MCGDENSSGKEGRHLLRGGSIRRHGSTQVVLSDSDEAQEAPQRPGTGESAGAQAKHCDGHRVRPRRSSTRLQGLPRRLSSHLLASRRRSSMHQLISSSDDEESTAEERSGSEMGEGEGSCAAKWPVGSCVAGRWSSDGEWYPAKVGLVLREAHGSGRA